MFNIRLNGFNIIFICKINTGFIIQKNKHVNMKKIALVLTTFLASHFLNAQSTPTKTDNPYPRTITVSGSAELSIVPDEIYVQVTLQEYDKRGTGKVSLETIKTNFLTTCKAAGIPDSNVSVSSYEGYDRWYWRKRKKSPDMNATISYEILFKNTAEMDLLVDKLDDEATQSFAISRTSHSNISQFRKQLKIQAIKAAKDKAIYLAEAVGNSIGDAVTIVEPSEGTDFSFRPSQANLSNVVRAEGFSYKDGISDVAYKKIKLRYEVNVVFALK
jgi:uncharacterized protein YggE